jgi:hypothetical protein
VMDWLKCRVWKQSVRSNKPRRSKRTRLPSFILLLETLCVYWLILFDTSSPYQKINYQHFYLTYIKTSFRLYNLLYFQKKAEQILFHP